MHRDTRQYTDWRHELVCSVGGPGTAEKHRGIAESTIANQLAARLLTRGKRYRKRGATKVDQLPLLVEDVLIPQRRKPRRKLGPAARQKRKLDRQATRRHGCVELRAN